MKVLAFSTGGAHITTMLGMLQELEAQKRLEGLDGFAGISAGAILAAFCATRPISEALKQLKSILVEHCTDAIKPHYKWLNVPLSALFQKSILDDSGLAEILRQQLEGKPLLAELYIGLTNETEMTYELHHFSKDGTSSGGLSIGQAVHASASIPVIFEGEEVNACHYSDGGVYHQIPAFAIEQLLKSAHDNKDESFDLTIIASSTWKYRPAAGTSSMPYLAKKTLHFLDCVNYNNLPSDRELIKEAIEIYKPLIKIDFKMYAVPTELLRSLHQRFTMSKLAEIGMDDVDKLLGLGERIVRANCATYAIEQDEPSPLMNHLKY
jgi:hypothetical protein